MPLFQRTVLAKHLKLQDSEAVQKAFKKYSKYFHNTSIQKNIQESKEEQFQATFLNELFVTVLGYTLNPKPNFNLTTELKNEKNAKKVDGAILKDGSALAVIELKGTNTKDLEKVRQQAFDYKANQTGCVYVVTSNFEKLRFYINNAVDFEEFDLFRLNEIDFARFYLCLAKQNLLNNVPLKIKEESIREEEQITKGFYKDYSDFKRLLFRDLVKRNMKNETFRAELNREDKERGQKNIKHKLFKKSQKLIDRFLFIFFAEDRGLLPPNSTAKILDNWDKLNDLEADVPLYDRFKLYFNYLDTGRKGTDKKAEIFAYNGGLFKPDGTLDSLLISDELLYEHTRKLSDYDFESEVDVNILGHIFENSLNEIESINAEIEGTEFDKQTTKRKKDGVFYTPKYITKYIVDNTIGKLCTEKKAELGIIDEDYVPNRQKATKQRLLETLENYREWLLQLTICDPACGSGAFLNQALDFLITEHEKLDELQTSLLGGGFVFPEIENTVLENNIYGVDLNEESVEIAKLSLWLRTAQPRRKLNDLSSNIQCGNSLIESKSVAGDKAFKWEDAFPKVFEKGGFDVVIGNPPYGAKLSKKDLDYMVLRYSHGGLTRQLSDTYIAFYILSSELLIRRNGLLSFIAPNTWRLIASGKEFRNYMLGIDSYSYKIVQHLEKVFSDATVDCDTVFMTKTTRAQDQTINLIQRDVDKEVINHSISIQRLKKQSFYNLNLQEHHYRLKEKIEKCGALISELFQIKNGIKPYERGKGNPPQTVETMKVKPFTSESRISENSLPMIGGSLFNRYQLYWENDSWVEYGEWLAAPRDSSIFEAKEKLIFRQTSDRIIGTRIQQGYIMRNNTHILLPNSNEVNLNYALGVLNSKLTDFYYWTMNPERGEAMAEVKAFHLGLLILPIASIDTQQSLEVLVNKMLEKNVLFNGRKSELIKYLMSTFVLQKTSKKLQNWHELEFSDFIKELNKAIKATNKQRAGEGLEAVPTLSKLDEMEWMEVFETKKAEALALKAEIDKTDREIDQMVYQLYGLTDEEIAIVEKA